MDKRTRSPNYPALSLPDAIEKVTALYRVQHTHSAPREVVVKGMGYSGLNGASATAISALHKYGLLSKEGEEVRVSDRAMQILHPHSAEERSEAIRAAGMEPPLFAELAEKFPGRLPSEEVLRNFLIRNSFSPSAAHAVILAYRDTMELVEREGGAHSSASSVAPQEVPKAMQPAPYTPSVPPEFPVAVYGFQDNERQIGRYDFEDGGHIRIAVSGDVDTEYALQMAESLISMKRAELKARNAAPRRANAPAEAAEDDE